MPVITYRGERSLSELADRVFESLRPAERETAVTALLRANPQLSRLATPAAGGDGGGDDAPQAGAVLIVPEIPSLRGKIRREPDTPRDQVIDSLIASLKRAGTRLDERFAADQAAIRAQVELIRSPAFRRALVNSPTLHEMAESAEKKLSEREAAQQQRREAITAAMREAMVDLEKRIG